MKNLIVSWEQRIEIVWKEIIWWIRSLEMSFSYSGRLQNCQQRKLYLASRSETQEPSFLPALHCGICGYIPSSCDQ